MRETAGAVGQPSELALDVARDLVGAEHAQPLRGGLVGRDPFGHQLVDQRAQEERVAGRDGVAGVCECRVTGGQTLGDQRLDGGRSERPRPQRRVGGRGQQFGEQLRRARRLARAHGAQRRRATARRAGPLSCTNQRSDAASAQCTSSTISSAGARSARLQASHTSP